MPAEQTVHIEYNFCDGTIRVTAATGADAIKQLNKVREAMGDLDKKPSPAADHDEAVANAAKEEEASADHAKAAEEAEKRRKAREEKAKAKAEAEAEPDEDDVWDDETPEDPEDTPVVTIDDLRSVAGALGRERGMALLKKHGATGPKLSALPESAYAAFHAEAKEMLAKD